MQWPHAILLLRLRFHLKFNGAKKHSVWIHHYLLKEEDSQIASPVNSLRAGAYFLQSPTNETSAAAIVRQDSCRRRCGHLGNLRGPGFAETARFAGESWLFRAPRSGTWRATIEIRRKRRAVWISKLPASSRRMETSHAARQRAGSRSF